MTKWEYRTEVLEGQGWIVGGKVDKPAMDAMLGRLGSQGWELVSAFDTNMSDGITRLVVFIFKRPAG